MKDCMIYKLFIYVFVEDIQALPTYHRDLMTQLKHSFSTDTTLFVIISGFFLLGTFNASAKFLMFISATLLSLQPWHPDFRAMRHFAL